MARVNSPAYPSMSLPKAIVAIRKIFEADRRNPVDRAVAARHMGYSGPSGASDKAIAALAHYGLSEKTGKGELRVSQLALDILHPDKPGDKQRAIRAAGLNPAIFKTLQDRFGDHVSPDALKSYLVRENFQDIAIQPLMNAYFETSRFLEQEKAFESDGGGDDLDADPDPSDQEEEPAFGGAKVGDLIQWEVGGALQMEKPMRVRGVSDDGLWVAVEGSETGIPMSEVMVQERATIPTVLPPTFTFADPSIEQPKRPGETEWMRNKVGKSTTVSLLVSGGDMGAKEIGKLIKLLEAQQSVLADDDEDDDAG